MGKLSREEQARISGCQYMLNLVKEKGIEEAEKELKWRCTYEIPLACTKAELNHFSDLVKERTTQSFVLLAVATLRDEFEFGTQRLTRFRNRFEDKADCLMQEYVKWEDYEQALKEEVKMDFNVSAAHKKVFEQNSIGANKYEHTR